MFKIILITLFSLLAVSPIFAIIAVRDTTPILQCDTLIDKNGVVSPVKIVSVGNAYISYKQCSGIAKKIYTIDRSKIQVIKSKGFTLPKPIPILTRAKRALQVATISTLVFFVSLISVIPSFGGDSGDDPEWLVVPFIALLISPFIIVGSFFNNIAVLVKAKKVGDQKAANKAIGGIFVSLLPILLVLALLL